MAIDPELRKLAQQALQIKNSLVPLHRVLDILATEDGDISQAINRYRDIKEPELRRALHGCAQLLRYVERETGLTHAWEKPLSPGTGSSPTASPGGTLPTKTVAPPAEKPSTKAKLQPAELESFSDDAARGQVRVAKMYTDGASKGNPGPAGIGAVLFSMDGQRIAQLSRAIGTATNNIAEYTALIEGMKMADDMGVKVLNVISDSELMVRQVTGVYKIKSPEMLKMVQQVMALKKNFEKFGISYVGREHNTIADALSTASLKKPKSSSKKRPTEDMMGEMDVILDDGSTE